MTTCFGLYTLLRPSLGQTSFPKEESEISIVPVVTGGGEYRNEISFYLRNNLGVIYLTLYYMINGCVLTCISYNFNFDTCDYLELMNRGISYIKLKKRKANWIGHILRRNCLLKQVIKGKINGEMEVTRRCRKLLDDLKDKRGYSHLKEEALHRSMWRAHFGRGFGPVIRQTTE
jgi:hypothetical protein